MAESHRDEIAKLETLYANNPEGRLFTHLAEAYRKAGELDRAREVLEGGLTRHSEYSSAYVVLGRVMQDLADPAAAGDAFRRVLDLDPENRVAVRALGDIARESGRSAEALDYYRQLQSLDPSDEELKETIAALEGTSSGAAPVAAETGGEAAAEAGDGGPYPEQPDEELSAGAAEGATDGEQGATGAEEGAAQGGEVVAGGEDFSAGADEIVAAADRSERPAGEPRIEGLELGPQVGSFGGLERAAEPQPVEGLEPRPDSGPRLEEAAAWGDQVEEAPPAAHEPLDIGEEAFSFDPDAWREAAQEPTKAAGELSLEDLSLAGAAGGGAGEGAAATGATDDGGLVDFGSDASAEAEREAEQATAEAAPGEPVPQPGLEAGGAAADEPPEVESSAGVGEPSGVTTEFGDGDDMSWAEPLADEEEGEGADVAAAAANFLTWDAGAGSAAPDDAEAVGGGAEDASGWSWDDEGAEEEAAPAMTTETMAELYRSQGLYGQAADIYRSLLRERPDDERLREHLEAVEREMHGRFMPPHGAPASAHAEAAEVEVGGEVGNDQGEESTTPWTDAHSASAPETTPYAWEGSPDEEEGVSIAVYLTGLLAWRRGDSAREWEAPASEPSVEAEAAEVEEEIPWLAYGEEEAATSAFEAGVESAPVVEVPEADAEDGGGWTPYGIELEVPPRGDEVEAVREAEEDEAEDLSWLFGSEQEVGPAEEPTGVAGAPPGESAEEGAVAEAEDDDLELFRAWLQSLKR